MFKPFDGVRKISHLILHHTGYNNTDAAIQIYKDYGVSAHYLIDLDGNIFRLVNDNDIAWHAGVSNWKGVESLNQYSIGIELLSPNPYKDGFNEKQMKNLIALCQGLISSYNIKPLNVLAHSDISYDRITGYLNRKQDPSYLFDWKLLAQNGVGFFPDTTPTERLDRIAFQNGDNDPEIIKIRKFLSEIGYKVEQEKPEYNEELAYAVRVFNRRYNQRPFVQGGDHDYHETENRIPPIGGAAYQLSLFSLMQLNKLLQEAIRTNYSNIDFEPITPPKINHPSELTFKIGAAVLLAALALATIYCLNKLHKRPNNTVSLNHGNMEMGNKKYQSLGGENASRSNN